MIFQTLMRAAHYPKLRFILHNKLGLCPLRPQGIILFLFALYLFFFVARTQNDLIAYSVSGGLLIIIIGCFVSVVANFIFVRKHLSLELVAPVDEIVSQLPVNCLLLVNNLDFPFLNYCELHASFDHPDVKSNIHFLRTVKNKSFECQETFIFLHRGFWLLKSYRISIGDKFGICKISWAIPLERVIKVIAPNYELHEMHFPAVSAISGEAHYHHQNSAGDYYDWRQYHPSDGINRILWKVYAHSGQLVVRKPEQTGSADKQLFLYVIAAKNEDQVVGAYRSIMSSLESSDLEIVLGSDGLTYDCDKSEDGFKGNTLTNYWYRLNQLAWHTLAGSGKGLIHYLTSIQSRYQNTRSLIVLGSEENIENILTALQSIKKQGLEVSVLLTKGGLDSTSFTLSGKFSINKKSALAQANQLHDERLQRLNSIADNFTFLEKVT
ncbi:MAG: DUF58 domain-containing protein [Deltaproteobacteria bacterium]|nr:DUF58 domain-containing protein [Deltaproteobacteria bacterium]